MSASDNKLYKKIPMQFKKLNLKFPNNDVVASYEMSKPLNLPPEYQQLKLPTVRLDMKEKGDTFQFEIMQKIQHEYILRLEGIQEMKLGSQSLFCVFVEPHSGPLIAFIKKLVVDRSTNSLPSQALRELVRQMVVAIELLRVNGLYQGNLSVLSIYYSTTKRGVTTIKFVNFCKKEDDDLEKVQLLDWVDLGDVLAYISKAAKALNSNLSYSLIDHLAMKLKGLTDRTLLPSLKMHTLRDPFFWDTRKRSNFYIHDIQSALDDEIIVDMVRRYIHWQLPWDSNPHNGLIGAMNAYRAKELDKVAPYNGMDPVANLRCMSGAYTHQEDLVGKIIDSDGNPMAVDTTIQKNQPDLCLTMYRMLRGEIPAEEFGPSEEVAPPEN